MLIITIIALQAVLAFGDPTQDAALNFTTYPHGNPVIPRTFGYPDAALYNGTYWVYHADYPNHKFNKYIDAYTSTDLKVWRQYRVLDRDAFHWLGEKFPIFSVATATRGGQYYLYFSAIDKNQNATMSIGFGVSGRPEGPYRDTLGKALFTTDASDLSGVALITDTSGPTYIYYIHNSTVKIAKLKEDMLSLDGQPTDLDLKGTEITQGTEKKQRTSHSLWWFKDVQASRYVLFDVQTGRERLANWLCDVENLDLGFC